MAHSLLRRLFHLNPNGFLTITDLTETKYYEAWLSWTFPQRYRGERWKGEQKEQKVEGRRLNKPDLSSAIMGNVRSLDNKMDELREGFTHFTETWLQKHIPASTVGIAGFSCGRADRTRHRAMVLPRSHCD